MSLNRLLPCLALTGLVAVMGGVNAHAQTSPGGSTACRLFPLACPGPTPPVPPPLLGAPDEQAEAPPPVGHVKRQTRHIRKTHAAKPDSQ